jgi:hypothetical protein
MITCQIFFQQVIIFFIFSILYFLDAARQLSIRSIFLHFTPNKEKVLPQRQRHGLREISQQLPRDRRGANFQFSCLAPKETRPATAVEQIFNLCDPRQLN